MHILTLATLMLSFLLGGCVSNQPKYSWNAEQAVASQGESIRLLAGPNKELIGAVSKEQLQRVINIKERVEEKAGPIRTTLFLLDGESPNAFASGQGGPKISINLSMLRLLGYDEDMTAALIGHELAHIYAGHKSLQKEREVASNIAGFVLGLAGVPMGGAIGSLATTAIITPYERDQEREADRLGIGYAVSAGFNPVGASRLFQRLGEESKGVNIPFLSTHPSSAERVEAMNSLVLKYEQKPFKANELVVPSTQHELSPKFRNQASEAGEPCSTSKECSGTLWCKQGICVATVVHQAADDGGDITATNNSKNSDSVIPSYLNTGLEAGANCASSYECKAPLICVKSLCNSPQ